MRISSETPEALGGKIKNFILTDENKPDSIFPTYRFNGHTSTHQAQMEDALWHIDKGPFWVGAEVERGFVEKERFCEIKDIVYNECLWHLKLILVKSS